MTAPPDRPTTVFEPITTAELWTDPHIAQQMLRYHLAPDVSAASRRHDFIDRSVAWLTKRFAVGHGQRVLDLGCGPGLYTTRLATTGADVVGIDFSPTSIEHARATAPEDASLIYICADYLERQAAFDVDLALMIMGDFSALSPAQRATLLESVHAILAPDGSFVFDVHSDAYAASRVEQRIEIEGLEGFWSSSPYHGWLDTFVFEDDHVTLDRYTITDRTGTRVFHNWLQVFSPQRLQAELAEAGFRVEILGDVAGAPYDPSAHEFAVIARPA